MTRTFPTLYKITAKGQVQVWNVWSDGAHIFTEEGLLDGTMSEHNTQVTDRKRSQTIEAQADLMAASKWNNKRKTYWESIKDARTAGCNLTQGGYSPMLAHTYGPSNSRFGFPCLIQPKLDGQRCIARKIDGSVSLWSRKGLPITSVEHINRSLDEIMLEGEIFDGELYNHGSDFNVSSGKIRATAGKHDTSEIDYWIYDAPRVAQLTERASFEQRLLGLVDRVDEFRRYPSLRITPTATATNFTDVKAYHAEAVEKGFEGAILRNPKMPYENKRSQNLLKYKTFYDSEYPIVGFNGGSGSLDGCVGSFVCGLPGGKTFNAKLKAPISELRDLFEHPERFAGKSLTVQYQVLSADGVPRFPVGMKIRG